MQSQERSILAYVLTNSKRLSTVTEMILDENKQHSVFKLEKNRKTYSDHNAIVTKCGYKKYSNKLTQKQISGTLKKDTMQERYDKWSEEV